jgi:hypothetical protein
VLLWGHITRIHTRCVKCIWFPFSRFFLIILNSRGYETPKNAIQNQGGNTNDASDLDKRREPHLERRELLHTRKPPFIYGGRSVESGGSMAPRSPWQQPSGSAAGSPAARAATSSYLAFASAPSTSAFFAQFFNRFFNFSPKIRLLLIAQSDAPLCVCVRDLDPRSG